MRFMRRHGDLGPRLSPVGNARLIFAGGRLRHAGKLDFEREVWLTPAQEIVGSSTRDAVAQANAWVGQGGATMSNLDLTDPTGVPR
jgi:hypothetical protein